MKKHIYLAGFMGAGKSRIGRTLAAQWNWPFYDTDALIEKKAAKTVAEIFESDGEEVFREMEQKIISGLVEEPYPAIVALGGGALMQGINFERIKKTGLLIYIKSAPEFILQRVRKSDKRPLLKTERDEQFESRLLTKITRLLQKREPVYQQADIVFERDGMELEEILPHLKQEIQMHWDNFHETD